MEQRAGDEEVGQVDIYEAVDSRRAVRAFSARPVSKETLTRLLTTAAWAPSSGKLQPWRLFVVAGEPLAESQGKGNGQGAGR